MFALHVEAIVLMTCDCIKFDGTSVTLTSFHLSKFIVLAYIPADPIHGLLIFLLVDHNVN